MKHTLSHSIGDAVMYIISDNKYPYPIQEVSPALAKFTGYTREELIGQPPSIFRGPLTEDAVTRAMREALKQGKRFESTITNYKKNGGLFTNKLWVDPIYDDGEDDEDHDTKIIKGFVSVVTDVTDTTQQAKQIRDVAENLQVQLYKWKAHANGDLSGVDLDKQLLFTSSHNAQSVWRVGDDRVLEPDFAELCLRRIIDPVEAERFVNSVNESIKMAAVLPQTEETAKLKVWSWEGTIWRPDENGVETPVRIRARSVPTFDHNTRTCVWEGHIEARELRDGDKVSIEEFYKALCEKEQAQCVMQRAFDCMAHMGEMGVTVMTGTLIQGQVPLVSAVPTGGSFLGIDATEWIGLPVIHNLCPKCLEEDTGPKIEIALSSPEVKVLTALERRYHETLKEWRRIKVVARYGPLIEPEDAKPAFRTYVVIFEDVEEEHRRMDNLAAAERDKADKSAIWSCVGEAIVIVKGEMPFEGAIMEFNPSLTNLAKGVALEGKLSGNTLQTVLQLKKDDIVEVRPEDTASAASYEFEITNEDGIVIACEATVAPVTSTTTADDDLRTAVVIRDRTIQKQLEEQKHQTEIQKTKNATLQTHIKWVQHEVKNSALSLQARVEVMQHLISGLPPGLADYAQEGMRNDMRGIEIEVGTLLNGVKDQVVLGCLASGTYHVQWTQCDAHELVDKLLRHFGTASDKHRSVEYHGFSPRFMLDVHALKHVTHNLESNALKYGVRDSTRVCMWMTDNTETWKQDAMRSCQPSHLRYTMIQGEVCVVDACENMAPGSSVPSNSEGKLYHDAYVCNMLCISFCNEVLPSQIEGLLQLINAGRLQDLFKEGVRTAGKVRSHESEGDGLALTRTTVAALHGALYVSMYMDNYDKSNVLFHVRCVVPVLSAEGMLAGHSYHDEHNELPNNICIVAMDDCKMQRAILKRFLGKIGSTHLVLGDQEAHILDPVKEILRAAIRALPSATTVVCILDQNLGRIESTGIDAPLGTHIAETLRDAIRDESNSDIASTLVDGLHIFIRSANDDCASVKEYMKVADGVIGKQTQWKQIKCQIARRLRSESQVKKFTCAAEQCAMNHLRKSGLIGYADCDDGSNSGHDSPSSDGEDDSMIHEMCRCVKHFIVNILQEMHALCTGMPTENGVPLPRHLSLDLHQLKGNLQTLMSVCNDNLHIATDICIQITRLRSVEHISMEEIDALVGELNKLNDALSNGCLIGQ